MAYGALQVEGIIDNQGNINQNVDIERIEIPHVSEPLQKEIKKQIQQKKSEPILIDSFKNIKCTEIKVEEKSFTPEQAEEIYEGLKEQKIITKEGRVKDTMKAQLAAGKLDLSQQYSKSSTKSNYSSIRKSR